MIKSVLSSKEQKAVRKRAEMILSNATLSDDEKLGLHDVVEGRFREI